MKTEILSYTIPAREETIVKVTMPSGKVYLVGDPSMVHPGNFPETATVLNSLEKLREFDIDLFNKYECCGVIGEVWSSQLTPIRYDSLGCYYRCGEWRYVFKDKYRNMKLDCVRLFKQIRDNGGLQKYNDPEEATKTLIRLMRSVFIPTKRQTEWFMRYFNIV